MNYAKLLTRRYLKYCIDDWHSISRFETWEVELLRYTWSLTALSSLFPDTYFINQDKSGEV